MAWKPFITNLLGLAGTPESGGLLQSYVKSTTTPLPLYSDAGITPLTNPVVADSLGQVTVMFSDALQYSWQAKTSDGATVLWEADVVGGAISLTFVNPDAAFFNAEWMSTLQRTPFWRIVKAFGAIGDGVTDDTAAIATALTAAGSNSTVYFPYGEYLISDTTVISGNFVNVIFERGASVKFAAGTSNEDGFRVDGDDCTLQDVYVNGNSANTAGCGGITLYGDRPRVIRPKVRDVDGYGIYIAQDTDDAFISDPDIGGTVGNIGIFQDGGNNTAIKNAPRIEGGRVDRSAMPASLTQGGIHVRGDSTYTNKGGYIRGVEVRMPSSPNDSSNLCIEVRDSPSFKVENNTTFGGAMGVSLDHAPGAVVSGNIISGMKINGVEVANNSDGASVSGNTIDAAGLTGTNGVAIQGATGTNDDVSVSGNTILGCDTRGVYAFTSNRVTVSGNTIKMAGGDAVYIQEQEGHVVSGNTLYGGSTPTATHGIVLTGSEGKCAFTGNIIENFATGGIRIAASSAISIDDVGITGNTFKGNTADITQALTGGATLGPDVRIMGNPGLNRDTLDLSANLAVAWGTGSPEGNITAGPGSTWYQTNGTGSVVEWTKFSGTGNTGWLPKYQEGTFTPTVTAATVGDLSVSYATQVGIYKRHGNVVYIDVTLTFTPTYTTASGAVRFAGLPFAAVASSSPSALVLTDITAFTWPASRTQLVPVVNLGATYATIQGLGSAVSPADLAITDKASGSSAIVRFRGSYQLT